MDKQLNLFNTLQPLSTEPATKLLNGVEPNKHNVFIGGFELLRYQEGPYVHIEIEVAQLENHNWIAAQSVKLCNSGWGIPFSLKRKQHASRYDALEYESFRLLKYQEDIKKHNPQRKGDIGFIDRAIKWLSMEMNKPEKEITLMSKLISEAEYMDHVDSYMGYCPDCKEFTRSETEPDAQDYDCPDCDNNNVVGAEDALVMGLVAIG